MGRKPYQAGIDDVRADWYKTVDDTIIASANFNMAVNDRYILATVNTASDNYTVTLPSVVEAEHRDYTIEIELAANLKAVTVQDKNDSIGWTDLVMDTTRDKLTLKSNGRYWAVVEKSFETYQLQTEVADISAANTGFVVVPTAGRLITTQTVIDTAITVGDAVITMTTTTGAVTPTITIATAGSAAGTVDSATHTNQANTVVAVGETIKAVTDAGSTDASKAVVVFTIRKSN